MPRKRRRQRRPRNNVSPSAQITVSAPILPSSWPSSSACLPASVALVALHRSTKTAHLSRSKASSGSLAQYHSPANILRFIPLTSPSIPRTTCTPTATDSAAHPVLLSSSVVSAFSGLIVVERPDRAAPVCDAADRGIRRPAGDRKPRRSCGPSRDESSMSEPNGLRMLADVGRGAAHRSLELPGAPCLRQMPLSGVVGPLHYTVRTPNGHIVIRPDGKRHRHR
jgi:hypothetical protein